MRKVLIAALPVVACSFVFLAEFDGPAGEARPMESGSAVAQGSTATPAESGNPQLTFHAPVPSSPVPGSESTAPTDTINGPPAPAGRKIAAASVPDERTVALQRLADHNMERLYQVLWQVLEAGEPDDRDFQEFLLATLEEQGDYSPGEVLAALVQTAPTPALQMNALQLLAEASQELSVESLNQALEDTDPAIRQSALAFFGELNANAMLEAVADAALSHEQEVRLEAFSTLEEMHEFAPVWEVAELLVDDADPQIRMRALELLTYGDRQVAIDRLALALGDPNPEISELAGVLLAELEQDPT